MIFVIGNGNSRQHLDLNELSKYGKTVGCNALYRDYSPTYLITHDSYLLHEIGSTNYTVENELFLPEYNPINEKFYKDIVSEKYGQNEIVENDKEDRTEFIVHNSKSQFEPIGGHHDYLTWLPLKNKIKKTPFVQDIFPINMGFCAIRLAYELHPEEQIFMLGFDIFGERNNLYDGTNGYYNKDFPHSNSDERIFLFNYLLTLYPDIKIKRVMDDGPELENIKNISYKDFYHILQKNA